MNSSWRVLAVGSGSTAGWLCDLAGQVMLVGRRPLRRPGVAFVNAAGPEFSWNTLAREEAGKFDLVMIRGFRGIELLPKVLSPAGVASVSGVGRDEMVRLSGRLARSGFRRLEFSGLEPGGGGAVTWLFYRSRNIVEI